MKTAELRVCFSNADLVTKMALLAHFAGINCEAATMFISSGRSGELARAIRARLTPLLGSQLDEEMTAFVQAAETFVTHDSPAHIRTTVYRAVARLRSEPWADAPAFIPGEEAAMDAITRLVRLTTALSYPPRIIARILCSGHFADLVNALYTDNRLRTSVFHVSELNTLAAIADSFILPERFVQEPELLLRRVERIAGR